MKFFVFYIRKIAIPMKSIGEPFIRNSTPNVIELLRCHIKKVYRARSVVARDMPASKVNKIFIILSNHKSTKHYM